MQSRPALPAWRPAGKCWVVPLSDLSGVKEARFPAALSRPCVAASHGAAGWDVQPQPCLLRSLLGMAVLMV